MATINFTQEEGAATHGNLAACSAVDPAQQISNRSMSDGGTPGTTPANVGVNTTAIRRGIHLESDAVNETTWAAGDYTIRLNVTTANANVIVQQIKVCRVDSAGTNQATISTISNLDRALDTVQVESFTASGAAQTAALTDRLVVIIEVIRQADAMGNQQASWTPDQDVDTPIERTFVLSPGAFLRRYEHMPAPNPSLRM